MEGRCNDKRPEGTEPILGAWVRVNAECTSSRWRIGENKLFKKPSRWKMSIPRLSATRLLEYFKFRLSHGGERVLLFKSPRFNDSDTRAVRRNISRICNSVLLPMQPDDLVSPLQPALSFALCCKFSKRY